MMATKTFASSVPSGTGSTNTNQNTKAVQAIQVLSRWRSGMRSTRLRHRRLSASRFVPTGGNHGGVNDHGRNEAVPQTQIQTKWISLLRNKGFAHLKAPTKDEMRQEKKKSMIRGLKADPPLIRFRRAVRIVQTLLRALTTSDREARLRNSELKFLLYSPEDSLDSTIGGSGLYFDVSYYKAKKETHISPDAKAILSMPPEERTEEQQKVALLSLKNAVESFAEFPKKMQHSLVRVGWYESYEASRVIIRQGHHAENFYMILCGTAVVTLSTRNSKTGETNMNTVAFLKKGNSFGELAIMHHSKRTATVSCQDGVELLAVGREDFVDIFMHRSEGAEPEFIQYLRTLVEFQGWPVHQLPNDDPKICLYMFFRRGCVICKDSNQTDWIYVIKSGSCRVLKKLQATKPDIRGLRSVVPNAQIPLSPRSRAGERSMTSLSKSHPLPRVVRTRPSTVSSLKDPEPQRKKSLPSIRVKSPGQVSKDTEEFEKKLEEERMETRSLNGRDRSSQPSSPRAAFSVKCESPPPRSRRAPKNVYVQLQKLVEKDIFGLIPIILGEVEGGSMSTVLVSDGAECILINKKFFLQHLTQSQRKRLRLMLRPYPTEGSLQQRLQDQTNWQAYKSMMMSTMPSFQQQFHTEDLRL